ncbi:bifunctional diaminohydroxyphosphoribosylaminopyrimidine deaminase/5-amino-6-(5-phosphoribosylamino)uracil reductase RibD [Altibacter sp. HG106]|uniref:bifunctional diaminohydroxyphosphoribosylaminopyrimidine deaminase/5-amino-6-(5-phosphoribosylamino)uracil reductase RibD n=1 Tax=Altibacter sp. HG106 TaxID=3023937 RepID=UPI003010118B
MNRCIQLAKNGLGTTYPNPLVGSVIVCDDKIIGEGWHFAAGKAHAEVVAIQSVAPQNDLSKATLFVNLEPCSHFGKTPPCADLIIEKGIKKVVVGTTDPNPKVAGRGIDRLKKAGCEVTVGVLAEECEVLNKRFFTFQQQQRPYVFLKWAQTRDGFIAPPDKKRTTKAPEWITQPLAQQQVHQQRAQEAAILVGTTTAEKDNPSLTTRHWKGLNPVRIVLDRTLRLPSSATLFNGGTSTIVCTEKQVANTEKVTYRRLDFSKPLPKQLLEMLFEQNVQSLIVEGGAQTLQQFIDDEAWDEAWVYEGATCFESGMPAPTFRGNKIKTTGIGPDWLHHYKNSAS